MEIMNDDIGLLLVHHMNRCYRLSNIPKNAPDRILQPLTQRTLVLSDIDIRPDDFSPLSRFLSSKQAINWLESIVLNKTSATTKRHRKIALYKNGNYSGLNAEGCRMIRMVLEFVSKSRCLQRLEFESISMSPVIISTLGVSLSDQQHGLKFLSLRNISLGDEGLRILTPHLSKCRIQCLSLQKCQLTDGSLPFLTNILKSQEAIQENNFWNSTLRSYPQEGTQNRPQSRTKEKAPKPQNTGLIVIDLSHNKLSNRGGMVLAHLLSDNKWILGLNLGFNRIEEKGIDRLLRDILSPDRIECALICLHIRGNPGCDDRILETLSQIAASNLRHPVFSNETHFEILAVISKWLNEQKEMKMPAKKTKHRKSSESRHESYEERVDDREGGLKVNGYHEEEDEGEEDDEREVAEEVSDEEGYEEGEIHQSLNHSNNGSRGHQKERDGDGRGDYVVSGDVLSVQSDDQLFSSSQQVATQQQLHSRYPQNFIESFDFDGYSPTQQLKEYNDINGRPPSRGSIRPRHKANDGTRPPSRQNSHRPDTAMPHQSLDSFHEFLPPQRDSQLHQSLDDLHLQRRGRTREPSAAPPVRSRSADGTSFRRLKLPPHANYMNSTRSFRSYVKTVKHEFPSDLDFYNRPKLPDHPRYYYDYSHPRDTIEQRNRGRRTEPYPKPTRRKQIYSPPPKKKTSSKGDDTVPHPRPRSQGRGRAVGDEKRVMDSKKRSHHGHGPNPSRAPNHGSVGHASRGQGSRGSGHHNNMDEESKAVLHQEAEAMMQQLGQGVMNELTKVVDTVSTDLKLVSEQLKNLSNSMSESMILSSSFVKDQDLSITSHGHNNSQQQGRYWTGALPNHPPQAPPNHSAVVVHQSTPERKQQQQQGGVFPGQPSRNTRYQQYPPHPSENQQELQSSQDSEVRGNGSGKGGGLREGQNGDGRYPQEDPYAEEEDAPEPAEEEEDDEVLAEMIRDGLKHKLLGLISQTMLLSHEP